MKTPIIQLIHNVDYYETGDSGLRICVIEPREGKLNIVGELKEGI